MTDRIAGNTRDIDLASSASRIQQQPVSKHAREQFVLSNAYSSPGMSGVLMNFIPDRPRRMGTRA